jgi:MSHA biogenesis protein MshL
MGKTLKSTNKIIVVATLLTLVGCQSPQQSNGLLMVEQAAQTVADLSQAHNDRRAQETSDDRNASEQAAVDQVLLTDILTEQAPSVATMDDLFDLSVNDMNSTTFFLSLMAGTEQNIVVHPDVTGNVTLDLTNVSVEQVLNVTRDIYGYEYKLIDGIYTVYPHKLRTEIFKLDYLDVQRVGVSDTSILIGKITSDSGSNNNGSSSNDSEEGSNLLGLAGNGEENSSDNTEISPGARVQTLSKTDFWTSLQETLLAIVGNGSDSDDRMVVVNPQAGLIVVKALPQELNAVRSFLERSELSVQRQVILETKILEIELNENFSAGINWNAISGQLLMLNNATEFTSEASISAVAESAGEAFSSILMVNDISTLLNLLETQGSVQVLSSPRVSTVNNQKAVIRVGSDEFFLTGVSSDTVSNSSSTVSNPEIELSSFFSGIALDVTPQISADGEVVLHIHPVVSTIDDQVKEFTVGSSDYSLPLALRQIRESDSIVRAKNGQVVVLGGLMQERSINSNGNRPGLSDIPLVNGLFKTKNKARVKTELVILMRPIVVDNNADWDSDVQNFNGRVKQMSDQYRQVFKR